MRATDQRDGTESATTVAAFRDLQIGIVIGGRKHTTAAILGLWFFLKDVGGNQVDTFHTVETIDFMDFLLQLFFEPL